MSKEYILDVNIRDRFDDSVHDKRRLISKSDTLELINKYGWRLLNLPAKEVIDSLDLSLEEVEEYVRRRKDTERNKSR